MQRINGIGQGLSGITYLAGGQLVVDHCVIDRFTTNGIRAVLAASGNLVVTNTTITGAATSAIVLNTTAGMLFGSFSHVNINGSANGVVVKSGAIADISDSTVFATAGTGLWVQAGVLTASRNIISNGSGAAVYPQGGVIRLNGNNIYNNAVGIGTGAGMVGTAGNNILAGNGGSSVSPTLTTY